MVLLVVHVDVLSDQLLQVLPHLCHRIECCILLLCALRVFRAVIGIEFHILQYVDQGAIRIVCGLECLGLGCTRRKFLELQGALGILSLGVCTIAFMIEHHSTQNGLVLHRARGTLCLVLGVLAVVKEVDFFRHHRSASRQSVRPLDLVVGGGLFLRELQGREVGHSVRGNAGCEFALLLESSSAFLGGDSGLTLECEAVGFHEVLGLGAGLVMFVDTDP